MTTTMTIDQFLAKHALTMFVEATDRNPWMTDDDDWNRTASHWRCTLRMGGRRMTAYFSQGPALVNPPTLAEVLDALASDARGVEDQGFHNWCDDLGQDDDSIEALKTYKACRRISAKLKALLGPEAFAELLECEGL